MGGCSPFQEASVEDKTMHARHARSACTLVMIDERFGVHTGLATQTFSNTVARSAIASWFDVRTIWLPMNPARSARCWPAMMNSTFGLDIFDSDTFDRSPRRAANGAHRYDKSGN
jgi:hypothetical protein